MTDRPEELFDRMAALVREMTQGTSSRHYIEADALSRLLPTPTDPDLIEAREIVAKAYEARRVPCWPARVRAGECDEADEVTNTLAGIKRGRELERGK